MYLVPVVEAETKILQLLLLSIKVIVFNIAHLDIQTSQLNKCNLLLIVPGTGNRTWD